MSFLGGIVQHRRSWISLLGFCLLTAIGAALALAMIFAGGSVALAGHQAAAAQVAGSSFAPVPSARPSSARFSGMITCSRCRGRHMPHSRMSSEECARACVRAGAMYMLVDGDRSYVLVGDNEAVGKFAGQRINITGTRQGDAILVDRASPLF
jgi:hypothetical protein